MEILKSLEASPVVESYHVLDFRTFEGGWYYKIEGALVDGSMLHAREYVGEDERNYAYHWQDAEHNLRVRWDNAPHYVHLSTHPHHKHVGKEVQSSKEITLPERCFFVSRSTWRQHESVWEDKR